MTKKYEEVFKEEGISLFESTKDFLNLYGDKIITYDVNSFTDVLDFLAGDAVQGMGNVIHQVEEEIPGSPKLNPIGHFCSGMNMLLMAEDGAVYSTSDSGTCKIANSGIEAVDRITNNDTDFEFYTGPFAK